MINDFRYKYFFLSNFYMAPVEYNGIKYTNSEAAFQAQKTTDKAERAKFASMSPSDAKRAGRHVKLRKDWEDIKVNVMYEVCRAKFTQNSELKAKLLATGNEMLIEGNTWGDKVWGQVNGEGMNYLGKCLVRIRDELRYMTDPSEFDALKTKDNIVRWIQDYMAFNGAPYTKAIIGISGGKDSTIAAALAVEALGKDRVVGVLMPQGTQSDISDSYKVVKSLGIKYYEINIGPAVDAALSAFSAELAISDQARINTPPRIRMATLYGVAACEGGRVINTCNLSEDFVGYSTKFGDSAGDFAPLANSTVTEIRKMGLLLPIPKELVVKAPSDGLCGKTDEDNLGFTYDQLDSYIRCGRTSVKDTNVAAMIEILHLRNLHKISPLPVYSELAPAASKKYN